MRKAVFAFQAHDVEADLFGGALGYLSGALGFGPRFTKGNNEQGA